MVLPFNHEISYMLLLVLLILASSCLTIVPMGIYHSIVPLQSNSLNLDLFYSCLKRRFLCSEDYIMLFVLFVYCIVIRFIRLLHDTNFNDIK